jgi:hypothetical protein
MRRRLAWVATVAGLVLTSAVAARAGPKKPSLDLRASPKMASPSTPFLFVATLSGGTDSEELHCLTAEWNWGEAAENGVHEPECEPFQPGVTKIERRFRFERRFGTEGPRDVELLLRKGDRVIARSKVSVRVTWDAKPPKLGIDTIVTRPPR